MTRPSSSTTNCKFFKKLQRTASNKKILSASTKIHQQQILRLVVCDDGTCQSLMAVFMSRT